MAHYVKDALDEKYERYYISKEELDNINKNMSPQSQNIRVVLVNNNKNDIDNIINLDKTLTTLIEMYRGEHVAIIMYGSSIKLVCPIVPLHNNIVDHIKNVVLYNCFGDSTKITKEEVIKSIKELSAFPFLLTYSHVFVY